MIVCWVDACSDGSHLVMLICQTCRWKQHFEADKMEREYSGLWLCHCATKLTNSGPISLQILFMWHNKCPYPLRPIWLYILSFITIDILAGIVSILFDSGLLPLARWIFIIFKIIAKHFLLPAIGMPWKLFSFGIGFMHLRWEGSRTGSSWKYCHMNFKSYETCVLIYVYQRQLWSECQFAGSTYLSWAAHHAMRARIHLAFQNLPWNSHMKSLQL